MGKLLDKINKQENGEDKEVVLKIYGALVAIDGHVWEGDWRTLVKTSFIGKYPNSVPYYAPSAIYNAIVSTKPT